MTKVLVVDDSITIRHELRSLLQGAGYEVFEASDGNAGFQVASANPDIDVVLSDLNMPGMDGLEMSKKIKSLEGREDLPILCVTTETSAQLKAAGKAAKIAAWIVKPFDHEKLLEVVEKVLQKRTQKAS